METIIQTLGNVASPLAVLAIFGYLVHVYVVSRQKARWAIIEEMEPGKSRNDRIRQELGHDGIDESKQSLEDQLPLIIEKRAEAAKQFRLILGALVFVFVVVAALAFAYLWLMPKNTDGSVAAVDSKAVALRDLVVSYRTGDLWETRTAENSFWVTPEARENRVNELNSCSGVDAKCADDLLKFFSSEIATDNEQLGRVSKMTDFYLQIVNGVKNGTLALEGACGCFGVDITRWQRSYYYWLRRQSVNQGNTMGQDLTDFALKSCEPFPLDKTPCPA